MRDIIENYGLVMKLHGNTHPVSDVSSTKYDSLLCTATVAVTLVVDSYALISGSLEYSILNGV